MKVCFFFSEPLKLNKKKNSNFIKAANLPVLKLKIYTEKHSRANSYLPFFNTAKEEIVFRDSNNQYDGTKIEYIV